MIHVIHQASEELFEKLIQQWRMNVTQGGTNVYSLWNPFATDIQIIVACIKRHFFMPRYTEPSLPPSGSNKKYFYIEALVHLYKGHVNIEVNVT